MTVAWMVATERSTLVLLTEGTACRCARATRYSWIARIARMYFTYRFLLGSSAMYLARTCRQHIVRQGSKNGLQKLTSMAWQRCCFLVLSKELCLNSQQSSKNDLTHKARHCACSHEMALHIAAILYKFLVILPY